MFLKFGSVGKLLFSKAIGVSLAVMLSMSLAGVPVVNAEQSDAMRELIQKRKLKRNGQLATYAPSKQSTKPFSYAIVGKATTETEVFINQNVEPMLSLSGVTAIQAAEAKYASIVSNGGWPMVPKGAYKKGSDKKGVAELNQRLFIEGYLRPEATQGEFASIFTTATQDAVTRFQRNHGLAASGQVDGPTLQALNVSAADRLSTIRANIPRLAEYSKDLGDRYLVVNIPAAQIEAVSNGKVYSRNNAIVGRPARPTPAVMTTLSDINFNPYWNAPLSIVERDIIPKIVGGNSSYLQQLNMKVFDGVGGPEIDPASVNWRNANAAKYHFRQEPGGENAMATAKINFPSPFGIYLHDTPEKQLFESGSRFYSSGCVRIQKVEIILNWILNGQDGIDASRINELSQTIERLDVKLATPPQLRVAYLTAWPVADGTVAFRDDIYDLDGSGFVLGEPLPIGEVNENGQRFSLNPVAHKSSAEVDAAEADGFSLFGRRSAGKTDDKEEKAGVKKTRGIGLFNWGSTNSGKAKKKIIKKELVSAPRKKTAITATKVASTPLKKALTPVAKKPVEECKLGKDGKLQKDCKVEAVAEPIAKPMEKPDETASATN